MARYTDEQYEMIKDSREKKSIAASAFKQRTHCGKGGSVKFPSDFMSRKELKAMNGEVKSYRLNSPMSWEEFKSLPTDLKCDYIKALREKFCVPDKYVAEMFGIPLGQLGLYLRDLKLDMVHDIDIWNKEGFLAWSHGVDPDLVKENEPESASTESVKYKWSPISWEEFKRLSDDKKREHIQWIRDTFNAPEKEIAAAFGINKATFAQMTRALECGVGKQAGGKKRNWRNTEFEAWLGQATVVKEEEKMEEVVAPVVETPVTPAEETKKLVEEVTPGHDKVQKEFTEAFNQAVSRGMVRAVPKFGQMDFECPADLALNTIMSILGSANVRMSIHWDLVEDSEIGDVKVV